MCPQFISPMKKIMYQLKANLEVSQAIISLTELENKLSRGKKTGLFSAGAKISHKSLGMLNDNCFLL